MPWPVRQRLLRLWGLLKRGVWPSDQPLSSPTLARWLSVKPETLRRDLSWLRGGHPGRAWQAGELSEALENQLGMGRPIATALVGLEAWALALLQGQPWPPLKLVAGFDSRQNRLETVSLDVPLYPTVELPRRVAELGIEVAILTGPLEMVPTLYQRLVQAGVRGLLNLSTHPLRSSRRLPVIDGSIPGLWGQLTLYLDGEGESDG